MRRCFQQMALIAVFAGGLCCPAFAASIGQGIESDPLDLVPPFGFEQADPFGLVVQADSMEAAQSLRGATYEPAPTRVEVQKPRKLGTAPVAPPAQAFRPAGAISQKSMPAAPAAARPAKQR
jgi:hypothetical protein